jgi:hypothetical protein
MEQSGSVCCGGLRQQSNKGVRGLLLGAYLNLLGTGQWLPAPDIVRFLTLNYFHAL